MKLWQSLYAVIWIVLMEFLLVLTPVEDGSLFFWALVGGHIALGLAIVGVTFLNYKGVRETRVPGRVKRIARIAFQLSILMAITGMLLIPYPDSGRASGVAHIGDSIGFGILTIFGLILLVHVVNAFAIITQCAAAAIGHDMWEDKEFVKETAEGEVPAQVPPAKVAGPPTP